MPHTTPRSLNDNLRLARLTVPQWLAVIVGGVSLWGCALLARGIHNPNMHIIAIAVPAVVLVAPILAFGRGGIERYPQQATRYVLRIIARIIARTMARGVVTRHTQLVALKARRTSYHAPTPDARQSD